MCLGFVLLLPDGVRPRGGSWLGSLALSKSKIICGAPGAREQFFFCFSLAVAVAPGPTPPMASLYRSPHRSAQPTASWNQTATQAKTMGHTRLIDTTRRTRRSSVRTNRIWLENDVQRIRVQSARSIHAADARTQRSVSRPLRQQHNTRSAIRRALARCA